MCGSITATAASLGYSASAVSQQLSTLERESGAVLLERTARSAALTDAGRLLARSAAQVLAAVERAEAELAAAAGTISGHLTVSAIPSLATGVAAALADVQRRHPALDIVMRETAAAPAVQAVADALTDLAITDDWSPRPDRPAEGLTRQVLFTEPVVLAVPAGHPLPERSGPLGGRALAAAVAEMTWLCTPDGNASRAAGDARLAAVQATPRRRWEFEGLITIAELVAAGAGCALLPRTVAETQPAGTVEAVPLTPRLVRHGVADTRTSRAPAPSLALCIRSIAEHVRPAQPVAIS